MHDVLASFFDFWRSRKPVGKLGVVSEILKVSWWKRTGII
jgi:hypothetical protein